MVKSMTGYGRASKTVESGKTLTVELRSVNHRYFEFSCRLPRSMNLIEDKIKETVHKSVVRGKVEVFITADNSSGTSDEVVLNAGLAKMYMKAYNELSAELGIENDIKVSDFARNGEIFSLSHAQMNADELFGELEPVLKEAVSGFIAMREKEGKKLKEDNLSRCDTIEENVKAIELRSPETVKEYRQRLQDRINELLSDTSVDEQRLLTETAVFADRIAVDEETVRLRSHLSQVRSLLDSGEPVGRKLDFIVQELNREINTVGSKAQDIEIARIVVDVKSEIEKIREQVQNIE